MSLLVERATIGQRRGQQEQCHPHPVDHIAASYPRRVAMRSLPVPPCRRIDALAQSSCPDRVAARRGAHRRDAGLDPLVAGTSARPSRGRGLRRRASGRLVPRPTREGTAARGPRRQDRLLLPCGSSHRAHRSGPCVFSGDTLRVTLRAGTGVRTVADLHVNGERLGDALIRPGEWDRYPTDVRPPTSAADGVELALVLRAETLDGSQADRAPGAAARLPGAPGGPRTAFSASGRSDGCCRASAGLRLRADRGPVAARRLRGRAAVGSRSRMFGGSAAHRARQCLAAAPSLGHRRWAAGVCVARTSRVAREAGPGCVGDSRGFRGGRSRIGRVHAQPQPAGHRHSRQANLGPRRCAVGLRGVVALRVPAPNALAGPWRGDRCARRSDADPVFAAAVPGLLRGASVGGGPLLGADGDQCDRGDARRTDHFSFRPPRLGSRGRVAGRGSLLSRPRRVAPRRPQPRSRRDRRGTRHCGARVSRGSCRRDGPASGGGGWCDAAGTRGARLLQPRRPARAQRSRPALSARRGREGAHARRRGAAWRLP